MLAQRPTVFAENYIGGRFDNGFFQVDGVELTLISYAKLNHIPAVNTVLHLDWPPMHQLRAVRSDPIPTFI